MPTTPVIPNLDYNISATADLIKQLQQFRMRLAGAFVWSDSPQGKAHWETTIAQLDKIQNDLKHTKAHFEQIQQSSTDE